MLKKTRAEQSRAIKGAWVGPQAHGFDGVQFKVRGRWNNPDFKALEAKLSSQVPNDRKVGFDLSPADKERILNECLVETIILDWAGVKEDEESPEIPFSKEKARELICDPALLPFRDSIVAASILVAKDGQEALEQDVKN